MRNRVRDLWNALDVDVSEEVRGAKTALDSKNDCEMEKILEARANDMAVELAKLEQEQKQKAKELTAFKK